MLILIQTRWRYLRHYARRLGPDRLARWLAIQHVTQILDSAHFFKFLNTLGYTAYGCYATQRLGVDLRDRWVAAEVEEDLYATFL